MYKNEYETDPNSGFPDIFGGIVNCKAVILAALFIVLKSKAYQSC
jgi:hypothetical protein